jgi:hypothetical protein
MICCASQLTIDRATGPSYNPTIVNPIMHSPNRHTFSMEPQPTAVSFTRSQYAATQRHPSSLPSQPSAQFASPAPTIPASTQGQFVSPMGQPTPPVTAAMYQSSSQIQGMSARPPSGTPESSLRPSLPSIDAFDAQVGAFGGRGHSNVAESVERLPGSRRSQNSDAQSRHYPPSQGDYPPGGSFYGNSGPSPSSGYRAITRPLRPPRGPPMYASTATSDHGASPHDGQSTGYGQYPPASTAGYGQDNGLNPSSQKSSQPEYPRYPQDHQDHSDRWDPKSRRFVPWDFQRR